MNPSPSTSNSPFDCLPSQGRIAINTPAEERLALLIRASFTAFGCRLEDRQGNRRQSNKRLSTSRRRARRRQGGKSIFASLDKLITTASLLEPVSSGDESQDDGVVGMQKRDEVSLGNGSLKDGN